MALSPGVDDASATSCPHAPVPQRKSGFPVRWPNAYGGIAMLFYVDTMTGPTMRGKRLKKHLQAAGYDVKLTQCYRLIAQMMGFRGWQELTASVGTEEASLGDGYVEDAEFERRRQFQLSVLLDEGIGRDDAEAAIDAIGPTNYCLPTAGPSADEEAFAEEWGLRASSRN